MTAASDSLPPALSGILDRSVDRERAHAWLLEALTHRTWLNENNVKRGHNQRLELLGDAVLELIVTQALFEQLPDADEGLLSRARAVAVNESALAEAARVVEIGPALFLGRGEEASGARDRARILADAFEAIVAAAFLSGGLSSAKALLDVALGEVVAAAVRGAAADPRGRPGVDARVKDSKSLLQEIVQREGGPPPVYVHDEPTGGDSDRVFHARVTSSGRELGRGDGRSRREAEMRAATEAIETLSREGEPDGSP